MHRRDGTRALSLHRSETIRQHVLIIRPVALSCRNINTTRRISVTQAILQTTSHKQKTQCLQQAHSPSSPLRQQQPAKKPTNISPPSSPKSPFTSTTTTTPTTSSTNVSKKPRPQTYPQNGTTAARNSVRQLRNSEKAHARTAGR